MRLTKSVLTSLPLLAVCLLSSLPPGVVTTTAHAHQQDTLSCLKFGECDLITCNPDGTYTYTFAVTNLSNFPATEAEFRFVTPSGTNISVNPYPLTPALPPNATRQITVTIAPGMPAGTTVCFTLSVHDKDDLNCCSGLKKCITLPACGAPPAQTCATGKCCGGAPRIHDQAFIPFVGKRLAVTTSRATQPTNPLFPPIQSEAVLRVVDLTETSFVTNTNVPAPMYYGPASSPWTRKNLGTIFGVTLDQNGNIFVAATSAYNGDYYPSGPGTVYRIDGSTGAISIFAQLPNFQDPLLNIQNYQNEAWPALGDVAYDCRYDQFFVTDLEDGKIYRLKGNTLNNVTGTTLNTFDPFAADNGAPGFAPRGERLVAVETHNGRVYYSVWKEDCGNGNSNNTDSNEIWSVALDGTGNFVPTDNRRELSLPDLPGKNFSNPVFDISFSREGRMLLGERTMRCNPFTGPSIPANEHCDSNMLTAYAASTLAAAHASRALEYVCVGDTNEWRLSPPTAPLPWKFNIGNVINSSSQCQLGAAGLPANAAGGVDYDYSNAQYTVWTTGDSLLPSSVPIPYGLQGFLPTGGGMTTAISIDLNGILLPGTFTDKAQIGDVEIVCPPLGLSR
ncbi:MAG: hypothetical protein QOG71_2106 [Pyrinomonadaceae bacterium]|nr:hypothetical protein [Pyrinomonadaceae bacterium]